MRALTIGRERTSAARVERFRFDSRLFGRAAYMVPPLVLVAAVLFGILSREGARLFTAGLEAVVPLVAGLSAASLLAAEPSLELQLATPGGFRPAALRRLALLFGWSALVSVVGWGMAGATGWLDGWLPRGGPLEAQLTWLAPLAAYAVGGGLLAVVLRSRSAAAAGLSLFWLAGLAFHDVFETTGWLRAWFPFLTTFEPTAADWLATRLALLALTAVAAAALAASLGAAEWLLGGEDR